MRFITYKFILEFITALSVLITITACAHSDHASPAKLLIGKNQNKYDVYLCKYSVVDVTNNIRRASHIVFNDEILEEYTSNFDCLNKKMHILKVTKKEDNTTLESNVMNINDKIAKDPINAKLLDAVCRLNNSTQYHRRK